MANLCQIDIRFMSSSSLFIASYIDILYIFVVTTLFIIILQKFFRRKPVKDLLPLKPVPLKIMEPWWIVHIGYVTEDDIRVYRVCWYHCNPGKSYHTKNYFSNFHKSHRLFFLSLKCFLSFGHGNKFRLYTHLESCCS